LGFCGENDYTRSFRADQPFKLLKCKVAS